MVVPMVLVFSTPNPYGFWYWVLGYWVLGIGVLGIGYWVLGIQSFKNIQGYLILDLIAKVSVFQKYRNCQFSSFWDLGKDVRY